MDKIAISESDFHRQADIMLASLAHAIEVADEAGTLDVDLAGGILTIELPNKKHYIINKHALNKQIWVASTISGGLHFDYDAVQQRWQLPDGRILEQLIASDLETLANIKAAF